MLLIRRFGICLLLVSSLPLYAERAVDRTAEQSFIEALDLKRLSLEDFSKQKYDTFQSLIDASLYGEGRGRFREMSQKKKNHIFWTKKGKKNRYIDAFQRAYPILKQFDTKSIPNIVLLIAPLESLWRAKGGNPASDYGYWQLVRDVVVEIKELSHAPSRIKRASINRIRSDPKLSTEAALIHLHRYYFYFYHVANFSTSDACFFSIVSYNWGAGNVKRMLKAMEAEQIDLNFSNFYAYLYQKTLENGQDKSMKAALEYLPKLWNLAQVVQSSAG